MPFEYVARRLIAHCLVLYTDTLLPAATNTYSNLIYCGVSGNGSANWCCDGESGALCCNIQGAQFAADSIWGTYWYHVDAPSSSQATSTSSAAPTGVNNNGSPHSTPTPLETPKSSRLALAIGAGVGVPLGVLAVGVVAFLFWRERSNRGRAQQAELLQANSRARLRKQDVRRESHRQAHGSSNLEWYELPHQADAHELDIRSPREIT